MNDRKLHHTFAFSFIYSNVTLLVGHPADRLKVAVQINLDKPQVQILKETVWGNFSNFFRGLNISILRQNLKILHRTLIMTTIPKRIDKYRFNFITSCLLKGLVASTIDTIITSPFENIKTLQMASKNNISILNTISNIHRQNRMLGFFFGLYTSIYKSFPSWFNLFFGYEFVKVRVSRVSKQTLLSTIYCAMGASIPITLITTPFDVIKSQRQALLLPKTESTLASAIYLIKSYGILCLWRGFIFRLLHKSLATAAGYTILNMDSMRNNE